MIPRRVPRAIPAAFLIAALGACTVGERAKALYLHQHQLLAALTSTIDSVEADDPDLADRLYDSEDELISVCRPLWEAGALRAESREILGGLRWQVFTILEPCAKKSREVEALIWRVDPDTARIYLGGLEHR